MATSNIAYGSPTTLTCTQASLATSSGLTVGRESAEHDNTSELAVDYIVELKTTTGTSPTGGVIEWWCACSRDGTTYDSNATGADAGITPLSKGSLLKFLGSIAVTTASDTAYNLVIPSLAAKIGGIPNFFNFVVTHSTGVNLNSTGGNHYIKVTPVHYSSV